MLASFQAPQSEPRSPDTPSVGLVLPLQFLHERGTVVTMMDDPVYDKETAPAPQTLSQAADVKVATPPSVQDEKAKVVEHPTHEGTGMMPPPLPPPDEAMPLQKEGRRHPVPQKSKKSVHPETEVNNISDRLLTLKPSNADTAWPRLSEKGPRA